MTRILSPKVLDGIACYSQGVLADYTDYPDSGFDLTDEYAETSFWVRSRNRLFSWLVRRESDRLGSACALDIGCGTGDFVQHICNDDRLRITGSEIYLKGLKFAKARLPEVEFVQYDVTEGILDQKFDIITAFDVFEHIGPDEDGMRNVHAMLKDDGAFIISVPQHQFLWSRLDEIVCHKRRYSRREMVTKLENNGFTCDRVTSHVFTLFPLMALSRILDQLKPQSDKGTSDELSDRVTFSTPINWAFNKLMYLDEALIKIGVSLPFGGTLVVVARKTKAT